MRATCLIVPSLLFSLILQFCHGQIQSEAVTREGVDVKSHLRNPQIDETTTINTHVVKLRGLCRDGWKRGSIKDFSGTEIPICLKVNKNMQTWADAQATCRKEYGFLMKLDSQAKVENVDLLSTVLADGITKFWTGLHTENDHLVWDDLIPNQVRPHNIPNDVSLPVRPWTWDHSTIEKRKQHCGQLSINADDDEEDTDKKRRRKRAPDNDDMDYNPGFDLSNFRPGNFPSSNERRQDDNLPPTGAFQTEQTRQRMLDQLSELPRTSLGVLSDHQLPGVGLSESNLAGGGFATETQPPETSAKSDKSDSEGEVSPPVSFDNTEPTTMKTINSDSQANSNDAQPFDLVASVKEAAERAAAGLPDLTNEVPAEQIEQLKDQLTENLNNVNSNTESSGNVPQIIPSENPTTVSPLASPTGDIVNPSEQTVPDTNDVNPSIDTPNNVIDSMPNVMPINPQTSETIKDTMKEVKENIGDVIEKITDNEVVGIQNDNSGISSLGNQDSKDDINKPFLENNVVDQLQDKLLENDKSKLSDIIDAAKDVLTGDNNIASESVMDKISDVLEPKSNNMDTVEPMNNIDSGIVDAMTDKIDKISEIISDIRDESKPTAIESPLENIIPVSDIDNMPLMDTKDTVDTGILEKNNFDNVETPQSKLSEAIADHINENQDDISKVIDNTVDDKQTDKEIKHFNDDQASLNTSVNNDVLENIKELYPDTFDKDTFKPEEDERNKTNSDVEESKKVDDAQEDDSSSNSTSIADKYNDFIDSFKDDPFDDNSNKSITEGDKLDDDKIKAHDDDAYGSNKQDDHLDDHTESLSNSTDDKNKGDDTFDKFKDPTDDLSEIYKKEDNIFSNTSVTEDGKHLSTETNDKNNSFDDHLDDYKDDDSTNAANDTFRSPDDKNDNIFGNSTRREENVDDILDDKETMPGFEDALEDLRERLREHTNESDLTPHKDNKDKFDFGENDTKTEYDDHESNGSLNATKPEQEDNTEDINENEILEQDESSNKINASNTHLTDDERELDQLYEQNTGTRNEQDDTERHDDIAEGDNYDTQRNFTDLDDDINENDTPENKDDINPITHNNLNETDDDAGEENYETDRDQDSEPYESNTEMDFIPKAPELAEAFDEEEKMTSLAMTVSKKDMTLSSCEAKLPSVCFSYEVEVMNTASTCENGWYGHVLLDTCFKIIYKKVSYVQAVKECKQQNARLVLANSEFERKFVLLSVAKDGKLFRGEKFWMETSMDKANCKYFDERHTGVVRDCNSNLYVVCVKDAKSLSVYTSSDTLFIGDGVNDDYDYDARDVVFISSTPDNKLQCDLTSAASEFPVLWFKDGLLVETKDKYVSKDISLALNTALVNAIRTVTNRDVQLAALQGRYWCEVWDRKTLMRKRSRSYNVRFADVLSFQGSMQLKDVRSKEELLFNMMNEKFDSLTNTEMDLQKMFADSLNAVSTKVPAVTDGFTFVDKIRSNPNVAEYHTYFTLNRAYTLGDEDAIYSRLKTVLRSKLGNRFYMANLPGKTSATTFRTMSLHSTVSCPAANLQTDRDLYGQKIMAQRFRFPKALLGEFANSFDNCSMTSRLPGGTARCVGDFYNGAYWGDVVANECLEEANIDSLNDKIWGVSPFTEQLTKMAETPVTMKNVGKMTVDIAQITDVAAQFTPTDINKIADVLEHSTQMNHLPKNVGENILKTVDKLMENNNREVHVANTETKAANRIIKSLERYAENADIGNEGRMRMVSDNVVMEIWDLTDTMQPVIGLAAESVESDNQSAFKTETIATVYNRSQLYLANVDAAIELPMEVFTQKEKGESISNRLTMMVFRKSKLFEDAVSADGQTINPTDQQLANLNSYVISASIAGKKLTGLKEKVKTMFRPLTVSDSSRACVWWDFAMHDRKGGWSTEGCIYDGRINGRDVCLCDHLTNFAVLLDFYGQSEPIPDHHELSLSIITVLGLSCSILGLSLTIISYVFFRKLRQGRAQQTLFNLSLALMFSMLVFLVGIKQTHNYWGCLIVAIMLHYFILVSFMWMLMEAILQYLTFVKILGTYITRFTLKTVLPAWGLPLIPVISVLSVDYNLYKGGPNYCWMDLPAFYFAFVIPITCIILVNIIIFFITVVSIFRRGKGLRSNQKKQKMAMTNFQAAFTSFILLGLTWLFGYLAISDARLPFQYIFTILNSLQGFFIFVLFVVRKKKVRDQWYILCCKGGEKDRVSRSLSASNSSYSNSSNRNSRNTPHERDRSDSTKTIQSNFSSTSNGFTNFGYDHCYDLPYKRNDSRTFRKF